MNSSAKDVALETRPNIPIRRPERAKLTWRACNLIAAIAAWSLACPVSGAILAGEEFPLWTVGPGKRLQGTPAVASGTSTSGQGIYLAAWREGWHGKGGAARIYATRLSLDGKILDPQLLQVAPVKTGVQEQPRVAFGGGLFLVVWQDFRNGKDYDILAARITPEGKVLDSPPLEIATEARNQVLPDVASDGHNFMLAWQGLQGDETSFRGYARTISASGKVGPAFITGMTPQPRLAWSGSNYLVIAGGAGFWQGTVQAVRLSAEGKQQGKAVQVITGTKAAIFSISGVPGKGWLVTSHRSQPDPWGWGGPGAMRCTLVNTDGNPENKDAIKEPSGVQTRLPGWLDIGKDKKAGATWPWGESAGAYDGKNSIVVWQRHHLCGEKMTEFQNCDLIAARLDGCQSLDPEGIPAAASLVDEKKPALASAAKGKLLLLYEKYQEDGRVAVMGRILQTE